MMTNILYTKETVENAMIFMEQVMLKEKDYAITFTKDLEIEDLRKLFEICAKDFDEASTEYYGYFCEFIPDWLNEKEKQHKLFAKTKRLFVDERYPSEYFTLEDIKGEWKTQVADDACVLGLGAYITNCLSENNGTLYEVKNVINTIKEVK